MRKWLFLLCFGVAAQAASMRGTVVEAQTGRALSRASVNIRPVPGSPGPGRTVRTSRYGVFDFGELPAGSYLVQATRNNYVPVQYGQKRWNSSGTPIILAESDNTFLTIRMPRYGAIIGTVMDENDVGMPEFEVAAYKNTRPPQFVTKCTADDQGRYRIYGLLPGSYLVRSLARQYDEGSYLPTFGRATQALDQAVQVDVELDQQAGPVNVQPMSGRLFSLAVGAEPTDPPHKQPIHITLASEMGRQTVEAPTHTFTGLAPGDYQLFGWAPSEPEPAVQGDYKAVRLTSDSSVGLRLKRAPELTFRFEGAPVSSDSVQVIGRRKDLAGNSEPQLLKLVDNRVTLAPGPWQFALVPSPAYYASSFSAPGAYYYRNYRADGWNDATVGYPGSVRFTLSGAAGSVSGTVIDSGSPVAGAPVFLEPYDLDPRQRVTDTYVTYTDLRGQYRFSGLAPGNYRVLSSFEYQMPDSKTMETAGAKSFKLDQASATQQDLSLYVIR